MKVSVVIGTRPEAIKLAPLVLHLKQNSDFDVQVVDTGQHRDMTQAVYPLFGITPYVRLDVMTEGQTLSTLTALLHLRLGEYMDREKPDLVVVQGDTTSALVGALEGFYHRCPIAHVEAGLRSGDLGAPYPEEANRLLIAQVVSIHFAPTARAFEQLVKEGKKAVYETGNTVVDALHRLRPSIESDSERYEEFFPFARGKEQLVLITVHRRESFGEGMKQITDAMAELAESHPSMQFVFPVHLNPNVRVPVFERLSGKSNVHLLEPIPYDQLLFLMSRSFLILTDSGGIQEEAPAFGIPLLVLRQTTERPEGIEAGCAALAGTSSRDIIYHFNRIIQDPSLRRHMSQVRNPYGDGLACERIARHLSEFFQKE